MSKIYPKNNSDFIPPNYSEPLNLEKINKELDSIKVSPSDSSIDFILNYSKSIEIKKGKKIDFIFIRN